jgi:hypothetical protein
MDLEIDLEAQSASIASQCADRNLVNYPYWQTRLQDLATTYREAQPQSVKQWFFDTRNPYAWAAFWFALFALVFSLVASVTGIVQTRVAYQALEISKLQLIQGQATSHG